MPPFKDEHILIIAPGSQTTLAQLGLPESFTPARLRFPTRMFPAETKGQWEPHKVRARKVPKIADLSGSVENGDKKDESNSQQTAAGEAQQMESKDAKPTAGGTEPVAGKIDSQEKPEEPRTEGEDVEMKDADSTPTQDQPKAAPEAETVQPTTEKEEYDIVYGEDPDSDEGAVWPLKEGRVTEWSCLFALLTHIYNTLSPPFHTPILLISQPRWTAQDHENLTQFFFEKFKTPAFAIMDSALAVCYAYGVPSGTVVDVGYEKADVTAVTEFLVHDVGRGIAVSGCGGNALTERLFGLLGSKGFTRDMCEQLKRSNICEVLPSGTALPGSETRRKEEVNPAAQVSTGASESGPGHRDSAGARGDAPRGPGQDTDAGSEPKNGKEEDDTEGVIDVAGIVASGKTSEYIAQKEKERQERAAARKVSAGSGEAPPSKQTKLPNSKRDRNTFMYEQRLSEEELVEEGRNAKRQKTPEPPANDGAVAGSEEKPTTGEVQTEGASSETSTATAQPTEAPLPVPEKQDDAKEVEQQQQIQFSSTPQSGIRRREVEVGKERFMSATGGILERLADAIHRTILAVEDIGKRGELWESMIILGNGSRVKGFKDALLSTLNSKYLISPSSATIFTSELPSNLSTPLATGASTPLPQAPGALSHSGTGSNVNPLLYAATTASNPTLNQSNSVAGVHNVHSSHGQTPTSIKIVKIPEYFPEWKEAGFEEAAFLGAQVAAKVIFVVDQGLSKGFMSRVEYNELGPQGIHETAL
ncbi:actin-like ATPase domain-containing protein [Xylona heveae TC161]|uniref:Actin-like ATPase domain-containing protein n=1 Tax=Xylona heveae (strain CBS 132557 / TC161) TaxID=1328760 RepID=A0A165FNT0_XYLHT|nr:actin-like ATPase domain-containing protein [Xylona heveae TC161]KZF21200.1 actin-like ATPase domain-containing protein [Xylona heveae TC161]